MSRNGDDQPPVTLRSDRTPKERPAEATDTATDAWLVRLAEAGQGALAAAQEARKEASEARREVRALDRKWTPMLRGMRKALEEQAEQLGAIAGDAAVARRQASSADLTAAAAAAKAEETGRTHVAAALERARKFDEMTLEEKKLSVERDKAQLATRREWTKVAVSAACAAIAIALAILAR